VRRSAEISLALICSRLGSRVKSGRLLVVKALSCFALLLVLFSGSVGHGASIESLGTLPLGLLSSRANALTADASVVVGLGGDTSVLPNAEAVVWRDRVIAGLGDLQGGPLESEAFAVSGGGQVIVGVAQDQASRAVRWVDGEIEVLAGKLGGPDFVRPIAAYGVSHDGRVIVGQASVLGGNGAFRWVDGEVELLDHFEPSPSFQFGAAFNVSPDGSIVVGWASGRGTVEAFRWEAGTMESLGYLPQPCCIEQARALALNPDGTVIVGDSLSFRSILPPFTRAGTEAFRWSDGVMEGLGDLPGGAFDSTAWGVTADGQVVVGTATAEEGRRAFWWDGIAFRGCGGVTPVSPPRMLGQ
jgi:uncharacterized membrane protein